MIGLYTLDLQLNHLKVVVINDLNPHLPHWAMHLLYQMMIYSLYHLIRVCLLIPKLFCQWVIPYQFNAKKKPLFRLLRYLAIVWTHGCTKSTQVSGSYVARSGKYSSLKIAIFS